MLSPRTFFILGLVVACGPKDPGDTETTVAPPDTDPTSTGSTDPGTDTTVEPNTVEPTLPPTTFETTDPTDPTEATTPTTLDTTDVTTDPTTDGADQTPPQGFEAVEAWLAEGHYKNWTCEAAVHGPIMISPHGMNRICSNDLLSGHPPDGGVYPAGSAGVKELYDDAGQNIIGYAVYLHTTAGAGGDAWYWYERVPLDHPAPHDGNGVVADGLGDSGPAMTICVGCHSAAGIDADHPGHDFVYTQVM
jgi:hypothetical protein